MNCYLHPDVQATAFCRSCGRPLCALCLRTVGGTVYCQDHAPAPAYTSASDPNVSGAPNPYFQAVPPGVAPRVQNSPGLAFVLGWIPGVGAIYNGQYLKGLVHAIIFGLLISLIDSAGGTPGQPFLGMMMLAFIFYMAFEAYHTAKKRQLGLPAEEWSSLVGRPGPASRAPVGPILLIVIGVLFLLDTLNLIHFREIGRFWPVLLIAVGAYMLWNRVTSLPVEPGNHSYPPAADPSANPAMGTRHE
jgi:TM2 domain-containing membrane protein YozV